MCVEGSLRYQSWQDRETGKNRSKVSIVVKEIEFMSRSQNGNGYDNGNGYGNGNQGGYGQQQASGVYDEDIPF